MNRFSTVTRIAHRRGAAVTPTRRLHLSSRQCQQDTQQPASANEQQEKPKFSVRSIDAIAQRVADTDNR